MQKNLKFPNLTEFRILEFLDKNGETYQYEIPNTIVDQGVNGWRIIKSLVAKELISARLEKNGMAQILFNSYYTITSKGHRLLQLAKEIQFLYGIK